MLGISSERLETPINEAINICKRIGNTVMTRVEKFVEGLKEFPLEIVWGISKMITAVSRIVMDDPEIESPEELGMKAELESQDGYLGPDDFESAAAYIEHLHNDIKIDSAKLAGLTETERRKYASIGMGLYNQALGERYGMRIEPEFWNAIYRTDTQTEHVPGMLVSLKENGIENGGDLDSYLASRLLPGSQKQMAVYDALANYAKTTGGAQTDGQASAMVMNMRRRYHSFEGRENR